MSTGRRSPIGGLPASHLTSATDLDVLPGPTGKIKRMPTISRFHQVVITMYFDDHGFPHFHARHADGSAKIRIDQVEVIDSTMQRGPALARAVPGLSRTATSYPELAARAGG